MESAITAGRELDALIAEKVMGLHPIETRCSVQGWEVDRDDQGIFYREPFPPYSTSIAAAWEVVKKMDHLAQAKQDSNIFFRLEVCEDIWEAGLTKWDEAYHGPEIFDINNSARAASAPLAVCLAALKAVEKG